MGRDAGGTWLVNRRARGPQSLTRRGGGVQQRPQAPADPKVSHEQVGAGTTTRLGQAAGERCGRRGGWEVCVGAVADGIGQVPFLRYLRWSRRRVGVGEGRVGGCVQWKVNGTLPTALFPISMHSSHWLADKVQRSTDCFFFPEPPGGVVPRGEGGRCQRIGPVSRPSDPKVRGLRDRFCPLSLHPLAARLGIPRVARSVDSPIFLR
jgi:hypothetical protein